jgi:hypothetical protein
MSSIAVFLVLGGATAFAAHQLGKNTVGKKQLKNNAVTTAKIKKEAVSTPKIKKNAVTTAKIKAGAVGNSQLVDNAVTTGKIVNGAVTGAKIDAGSTPFSQIVARLRGTAQLPFTGGAVYPFNSPSYTQNSGEDNQFVGSLGVNFAASCTQPRSATAYLLVDAPNPAAPTPNDIAGLASVSDTGSGSVSRQAEFVPFAGTGGMSRFAPAANTQHTFTVFLSSSSCTSGSGVTVTGAGVDVIGTK